MNNEFMRNAFHVRHDHPRKNTPAVIAAHFDNLAQSNESLQLFIAPLQCTVFLVYPLSARRGGCGGNEHVVTTRKPSLYPITNPNDQWCMVRAFVVGKAYVRHNVLHEINLVDFERLWRDENGEQSRQALALITAAGLSRDEGHTLDDLKTLQEHLHVVEPFTWRLALFEKESNYECIWRDERRSRHDVCLYMENSHYAFLGRPCELFNAHAYCLDCRKMVKKNYRHARTCKALCWLCMRYGPEFPCEADRARIRCPDCLFTFVNQDCFDHHLQTVTPNALDGRSRRVRRSICQTR